MTEIIENGIEAFVIEFLTDDEIFRKMFIKDI